MPTLILEAFGKLSAQAIIDAQEEDLYSVFRERAELMGWAASTSNGRSLLWTMEEAELNPGIDTSLIGWAQVGLGVGPVEPVEPPTEPRSGWSPLPYQRRSTDPVLALPALPRFTGPLWRRRVSQPSSNGI